MRVGGEVDALNRGRAQFDKGQFSQAASDLAKAEEGRPNAYTAIWLYLALARSGSADAQAVLATEAKNIKVDAWPGPVVALFLGETNPQTVTQNAADVDSGRERDQKCEANFYIGEWHILRDERQQAREHLSYAQTECSRKFFEYRSAISELGRLDR